MTDWNLIADFENAILPTNNYTVSFEDKKGKLVPVKSYDFPGSSTLLQWKLNPWGDYDAFSGFQFYYDAVSNVVKLKVNPRSWVD